MGISISAEITAGFWFSLSVMFILLPLPWLGAIVLSSLIHEMFHVLAMYAMGIRSFRIHMKSTGLYLETDPLTARQEMIAAVAGPAGGLLLLLFHHWIPKTAMCAFIQSCFHLLPIYPLDGGRALRSWTKYMGRDPRICCVIEGSIWVGLFAFFLYISYLFRTAIIPLCFIVHFTLRTLREKYLANGGGKGYNIRTKI